MLYFIHFLRMGIGEETGLISIYVHILTAIDSFG